MSLAVNFGSELLWIMRELQYFGKSDREGGFPDAVAKYMLVQMGINVNDVDEANRLYWKKFNDNTLGDLDDAVERIRNLAFDKDYLFLKTEVVSALAAIIQVQHSEVTPEQKKFIDIFQYVFDLKPSDFQSALQHGTDMGIALKYVVNEYIKTTTKQPALPNNASVPNSTKSGAANK
jgi:hypothetical protein